MGAFNALLLWNNHDTESGVGVNHADQPQILSLNKVIAVTVSNCSIPQLVRNSTEEFRNSWAGPLPPSPSQPSLLLGFTFLLYIDTGTCHSAPGSKLIWCWPGITSRPLYHGGKGYVGGRGWQVQGFVLFLPSSHHSPAPPGEAFPSSTLAFIMTVMWRALGEGSARACSSPGPGQMQVLSPGAGHSWPWAIGCNVF